MFIFFTVITALMALFGAHLSAVTLGLLAALVTLWRRGYELERSVRRQQSGELDLSHHPIVLDLHARVSRLEAALQERDRVESHRHVPSSFDTSHDVALFEESVSLHIEEETSKPLFEDSVPSTMSAHQSDVSDVSDVEHQEVQQQAQQEVQQQAQQEPLFMDARLKIEREELSETREVNESSEPSEPDEPRVAGWASALWGDLMRGSLITRLGALMLLVGLSYLLQYASKRYQPSLVTLHLIAGSVAVALTGFGWRWASRRATGRAAALATQGAGLALIALTVISATRLYGLISLSVGVISLSVAFIFGAALALRQRSVGLMISCTLGALLSPLLLPLKTYAELTAYQALLGYYTLIGLVILGLSLRASWRSLNLLGFTFTSAALLAWADQFKEAATKPFEPSDVVISALYGWTPLTALICAVVIYTLATRAHSRRAHSRLRGWLDGCIWWGTPSLVFGVITILARGDAQVLGVSLSLLGAAYLAGYLSERRSSDEGARSISSILIRLVALCLALASALLFGLEVGLLVWSLEGFGLAWLALRQREELSFWVGVSFSGISALVWFSRVSERDATLKQSALGLCLAIVLILMAWLLQRRARLTQRDEDLELREWTTNPTTLEPALTLIGGALALYALTITLERSGFHITSAALISLGGLSLMYAFLGERLQWLTIQVLAGLTPIMTTLFALVGWTRQPLQSGGEWVIESVLRGEPLQTWSASLVLCFTVLSLIILTWRLGLKPLYRSKLDDHPLRSALTSVRFIGRGALWVVSLSWGALELHTLGEHLLSDELGVALAALGVMTPLWAALGVAHRGDQSTDERSDALMTRLFFPIWRYEESFKSALIVFMFVTLVTQVILWLTAAPLSPLAIPLVNPVDLAQWLGVYLLWKAGRSALRLTPQFVQRLSALLLFLIFMGLNVTLARGASALDLTPYSSRGFWSHAGLQAAVALLWGIFAVALMRVGSVKSSRALWWTGLALLGATVLKIWSVDLQSVEQLGKVISLIGVGALMLSVGYWAPAPSDDRRAEEASSERSS